MAIPGAQRNSVSTRIKSFSLESALVFEARKVAGAEAGRVNKPPFRAVFLQSLA